MTWCEYILRTLQHPTPPIASEFILPGRSAIVPTWYRRFQAIARDHVAGNELPTLALAPQPEELGWLPNPRVVTAQESEVDTFGLVEMAGYDTNAEDWEDSDESSETTNI